MKVKESLETVQRAILDAFTSGSNPASSGKDVQQLRFESDSMEEMASAHKDSAEEKKSRKPTRYQVSFSRSPPHSFSCTSVTKSESRK